MTRPSVIIAFLFVISVFSDSSRAQRITGEVVVSGTELNDGFAHLGICDSQGQPYRQNPGRGRSVMRVARDGSTTLFTLPAAENSANEVSPDVVGLVAPVVPGLAILNTQYSRVDGVSYLMYRFNGGGQVVSQHRLSLDFKPTAMAATSARKMIVVGYRSVGEGRIRVGAVLDKEDRVLQGFDFPAGVSEKRQGFEQMTGSDGVAYFSDGAASGAIYSITESGVVTSIPVTPMNNARHHKWMFGPGVAVQEYEFPSDDVPRPTRFDVYDLNSGRKLGSKTLPRPVGFATACYLGDEVTVWAHSGKASPALRLVTVHLEQ